MDKPCLTMDDYVLHSNGDAGMPRPTLIDYCVKEKGNAGRQSPMFVVHIVHRKGDVSRLRPYKFSIMCMPKSMREGYIEY